MILAKLHDAHKWNVGDSCRLDNSRLNGKVVAVFHAETLSDSVVTVQWEGRGPNIPFKGNRISKLRKG